MSEPVKLRSYGWLFWSLACFGLAADLGSKYAVNAWLDQGRNHIEVGGLEHRGYEIIPRMFSLVRQEGLNKGALFGMGNDPEHGYKANWVFAGVSTLAAIGIIIWSFRPTVRGSWALSIALGLILAGALGNLFDRVVMGGVRDFIWVYYQDMNGNIATLDLLLFKTPANFPVFNLADSCLCIGAAILLLQTFFTPAPKKTEPAPAARATN